MFVIFNHPVFQGFFLSCKILVQEIILLPTTEIIYESHLVPPKYLHFNRFLETRPELLLRKDILPHPSIWVPFNPYQMP